MKFYDREQELAALEQAYSKPGANLVVISGRRRIGKSRLVSEFIKTKKAINVFIVPKEEKQVAKDIEEEIKHKLGYSPPFDSFKDALQYLFEQDVKLVCFDEFPNVLAVNQAIPFELQKLWDNYKETKNIMLIVSGSYAGMMNRLLTAKKAPLFNRATNTINLQPLTFKTITEMLTEFGISNPSEYIKFYSMFGGIPFYYVLLEKIDNRSFENTVNSFFFDVGAQLRDEGENILRQEFGNAYPKYYAILEAISAGYVSMNEISQKVGIRSTTLAKYMKALQHDFKLVERVVPFGENAARSKKGLYLIQDNTLAFWFSLVYGKLNTPSKEALNTFTGKRFEILCRQFLSDYLTNRGEQPIEVGKWWGTLKLGKRCEAREIDIVVETDQALYLGECKWTEQKIGEKELNQLKESSESLSKIKKPLTYVLFSKSGFKISETPDILLFDAEKITKQNQKSP